MNKNINNQFINKRRWFEVQWKELEKHCSPWYFVTGLIPLDIRSNSTCPCCGYPTITRRYWYEICVICRWEDDGQDDGDANEVSGVNSPGEGQYITLSEARANFKKFHNIYGETDKQAKKLDNQQRTQLKDLFDKLLSTSYKQNIEPVKNHEVIGIFKTIKTFMKEINI